MMWLKTGFSGKRWTVVLDHAVRRLFVFAIVCSAGIPVTRAAVTVVSDATGDAAAWGDLVNVTITISNPSSTQEVSSIVSSIDLGSANYQYVSGSTTITTPDGGTISTGTDPTITGTVLEWDLDSIYGSAQVLEPAEPDEEATIIFEMRVGCDSVTYEFVSQTDVVLSLDGARTWTGLYTLTVEPPAFLLTLSPTSQTVQLGNGEEVTWTATIENVGLGIAHNIAARFGLDASFSYVEGSATIGSAQDGGSGTYVAETSPDGDPLTAYIWMLGDDITADPDGAGGLEDLDGDGEYDDLAPNETVTITGITARLQACDPIGLFFDVTTGYESTVCVDTETSDPRGTVPAYVSTVPASPEFTYAFSDLTGIDYCNGSTNETFTVTNDPGHAPIHDLEFTLSNFPAGIDFTNLVTVVYDWDGSTASNPQTLAPGITFDRTTGKLTGFPVLDSGQQIVVTFDVDSLTGADAYCSSSALVRSISIAPTYTDLCGDPYTPVSTTFSFARQNPVRLRLTTGHSGTDEIYISQDGIVYSISATYSAVNGDPWSQLASEMPITLTYTYDSALNFVSSSGSGLYVAPVHDSGARTLTWANLTFDQLNAAFSADLVFDVDDRAEDPCQAGREYVNTFNVETIVLTDCLLCNYSLGGDTRFRGYINQDTSYAGSPINDMDKQVSYINTLAGSQGERCRPYEYTVTVDLGTGAPTSWSGLTAGGATDPDGNPLTEVVLIERPTENQTFYALRSVIYNGTDYGPNGTSDITNADVTTFSNGEVWLFLGGLDAATADDPDDGYVLEVVWEFDPPDTIGSVAQFSEIRWPDAGSNCGTEFGYETGVWVSVGEQSLDYDYISPSVDYRGVTDTHTFDLDRLNTAHYAYDVVITVDLDPEDDGLDYSYDEGTTVFSGFLDETGSSISAFEPTVSGDLLIWDFRVGSSSPGDEYRVLSEVGSISMDLMPSPCETDPSYTVQVDYSPYCGYEADPTGASDPTAALALQTVDIWDYSSSLLAATIPAGRTLYEYREYWYLRLSNSGNAPAWNVGLEATFGAGFDMLSAELVSTVDVDNPESVAGTGLALSVDADAGPGDTIAWTFQGANFTSDPDGAGGLADADGDGVYDDLPSGSTAYILLRIQYVSCTQANMTIDLTAEAGGILPGTSYDDSTVPGDMVTTRPATFCDSATGSTGTVREGPSVLQTIHVDPELEVCTSASLTFRAKNIQQATVYQPVFRQYIPQSSQGVILDLSGATYDLDADGDGTYEVMGAALPSPTITPGAGTDPDEYEWSYTQFGTDFDNGFALKGVINLNMTVWGDCNANGTTVTFGSEMDFVKLCGDSVTTSRVETDVTLLDLVGAVTIEARNLTAGETAWSTSNVYGGVGDEIEYRITAKNDGGAGIRNIMLEVDLPQNFGTVATPTSPPYASRVGNVLTWEEADLLTGDMVLDPAEEAIVQFTATLDGTDICTNRSASISLTLGCLANGPVGECTITTSLNTHSLTTQPSLSTPEVVITASDLVTGDGDSDMIDTNGVITLTVTGSEGTAAQLVLTAEIPSGWLWDGYPTPVFTYTSTTPPATFDSIDGCTVDATDPVHPVFTFTRGGVAADSLLRADESISVSFYVVQDNSFDTASDKLTATETSPIETGYDPTPPADVTFSADLDYWDSCGGAKPTVNETETFTVHTPDLDVQIAGDNPGIVTAVGDTLGPDVVVANNGEYTYAENGVLEVTIGNAWTVTGIPAIFAGIQDLSDTAYEWVQSPTNPNEYYLRVNGGGDPGLFEPTDVYENAVSLSTGTLGSLADGEWAWGDNDGLGYSTIYVNLNGTTPDLEAMTADVPARTLPPVDADTKLLVADLPDILGGSLETYSFTIELADEALPFIFEAHVDGEVYHEDGSGTGNDYSFDDHAAALIGFRISKVLTATSEADSAGANVWIGEDGTYRIEAEWFGLQSGQTVSAATVTDALATGQGYVQHAVNSTPDAVGTSSAPPTPATITLANGGTLTWEINDFSADGTFQTDIVTRTLNVVGNTHLKDLKDTGDATFTYMGEDFDNTAAGFPAAADREVTTTVRLPATLLIKWVRNRTLDDDENGGVARWNPAGVSAQAGDELEYQLVLMNDSSPTYLSGAGYQWTLSATATEYYLELSGGGDPSLIEPVTVYYYSTTLLTRGTAGSLADGEWGWGDNDTLGFSTVYVNLAGATVPTGKIFTVSDRAPAYDVVITDTVPTKLAITPFGGDSIDNDDDGSTDEADEGGVSGQDVTFNFGNTAYAAFNRLDGGGSIMVTYEVIPAATVNPDEELDNSAEQNSDSLTGASGGEVAPQGATGATDGARALTNTDTVKVTISPIDLTGSKVILDKSTSGLTNPSPAGDVVIGEEIQYRLRFTIAPSTVEDLVITDLLPVGLTVIEGADVVIGAPFSPTGSVAATISEVGGRSQIKWDVGTALGDLALPAGNPNQTVDAIFIARVDNISGNQEATVLDNTDATVEYTLGASTVTLDLEDVAVTVREPVITATKGISPDSGLDAGDVITITVSVQNDSTTVPAYNVDVYDNLAARNLTYNGNITGDTPDTVFTSDTSPTPALPLTPAANAPVFRFGSIAPSGSKTFTFDAVLTVAIEPLEVIDNTLEIVWTSLPNNTISLNSPDPTVGVVKNSALASDEDIGADGSTHGMRNGDIPADAGTNDYETSASDDATTSLVSSAKTDLGFVDAAAGFTENTIGAHRKFRITIDLPEGTIEDLTVTDVLNSGAGGASWILQNDATYDISYALTDIYSINGNTALADTGEIETAIELATAGTDVPADESSGTVAWNLGTIVTNIEDDGSTTAISPQIVITYYCRINNDSVTDAGDTLTNSATVSYTHGETGGTVTLGPHTTTNTVVEPVITTDKLGRNITKGDADFSTFSAPDAGDILEYQVTLTNGSTNASIAYDVNLVDTISTHITWSSTVSATLNGAAWGGDTTPTEGATTLTWGRDDGDSSIDINVGSTFVIVYRVIVENTMTDGVSLNNTATADWRSLNSDPDPGATDSGRDGDGTNPPNDYTSNDSVTVSGDITYAIDKTITATSAAHTDTADGTDPLITDLVIGETVTFHLTATFGEGTTTLATLTDTLPTTPGRLSVVSATVVSIGGNTTGGAGSGGDLSVGSLTVGASAGTIDDTNADTYNDRAIFEFGTVVNSGADNTLDSEDQIVVEIVALVLNHVDNQDGDVLTNTGRFDANGSTVGTDTEQVEIVEPVLTVDVAIQSSPATLDAGGEITYRVTVTNTGDIDAFGVILADVLDSKVLHKSPYTITYVSGVDITSTGSNDLTVPGDGTGIGTDADGFDLTSGSSAVFEYVVVIQDTIEDAEVIDNDVDITWSSLSGGLTGDDTGPATGERTGDDGVAGALNDYAAADAVTTTADLSYSLVKTLTSSNVADTTDPNLTIGEQATYTIELTFGEGTTPAVTFQDDGETVNEKLEIISASAVLGGNISVTEVSPYNRTYSDQSGDSYNDRVTFNFGDVTNTADNVSDANDKIVITLVCRVLNDSVNNAGDTATNTAEFFSDGTSLGSDTADIGIVEPMVSTDKLGRNITKGDADFSTFSAPDAGDILEYRVTLTNTSTNASIAYDVNLVDTISTHISWSSTVSATLNGAAWGGDTTPTEGATTLTWGRDDGDSSIDIDVGSTFVIVYRVIVENTMTDGVSLDNTATSDWRSLNSDPDPGATDSGRDGDGTNPPNDYTSNDSVTVSGDITYAFDKTITATSAAHTGVLDGTDNTITDLVIGETVTFHLTATFGEGTTTLATLTDTLPTTPGRLSVVSATVVSIGGNTTGGASSGGDLSVGSLTVGASAGTIDDTNADTYNDRAIFEFGTVVNSGADNTLDSEDQIVVEIVALTLNHIDNQDGDVLTNTGRFDANGSTVGTDTEQVEIVEPVLTVDITIQSSPTPLDAGGEITYRVTVSNTGVIDAFGVMLADVLDSKVLHKAPYTITYVSGVDITSTGSNDLTVPGDGTGIGTDADGFDLTVHSSAVFEYVVVIQDTIEDAEVIDNDVDITWSSLSGGLTGDDTGPATGERTGSDGGSRALNDYADADAVITAADLSYAMAKAITATSAGHTGTADGTDPLLTDLVIGETVTFQLTATFGEGTTTVAALVDELPVTTSDDGLLEVVSSQVISIGANLTTEFLNVGSAGTASDSNLADGYNDRVTFTFGTVTNTADNTVNTDDQIVVEIVARLVDDVANQEPDVLTNTGRFDANGGTVATDTEDVEVVEPQITTTKSVNPTTDVEAGDTLTYTVRFTNTGSVTAFEVTATDTLAQGVAYTSLTSAVDQDSNPVSLTVTDNGTTVDFDGNPAGSLDIDPGDWIEIVYVATAQSSLTIDGDHTNTVDADWTSLPGVDAEERDYDDTAGITVDGTQDEDDAAFTVNAVVTFTKTDDAVEKTIGETINYTLSMTFPLGTVRDMVVTDVLPAGVIFNNDSSVTPAPDVTPTVSTPNDGSAVVTVTWTFGDRVISSNPTEITYTTTVADTAQANHGETKINTATLSYTDVDGNPQSVDDTEEFDVVEPTLTSVRTVENLTSCDSTTEGKLADHAPSPGDSLEYVVTITNPAASTVTAYEWGLELIMGTYASLDTSFTVTAVLNGTPLDGGTTPAFTVTPSGTGPYYWGAANGDDIDLDPGDVLVFTYRVTIDSAAVAGTDTSDTVNATWTSLDGTVAGERDSGGGVDDYVEPAAGSIVYIWDEPAGANLITVTGVATVDADGVLSGAYTGTGPVGGNMGFLLQDGAALTVTGDGVAEHAESGDPSPFGTYNVAVDANATATLTQAGLTTMTIDHLEIGSGATLTLTGVTDFVIGSLSMGAGSTLVLPPNAELTVVGDASMQGTSGLLNYARITSTDPDCDGYILHFDCEYDGDGVAFTDVGNGYVEFNGIADLDHAVLTCSCGTNPYIIYNTDEHAVWSDLAFGSACGATETIRNTGDHTVCVDGYSGPTANWIGGTTTEDEDPGLICWKDPTPVRELTGTVQALDAGGTEIQWSTVGEDGIALFRVVREISGSEEIAGVVFPKAGFLGSGEYTYRDRGAVPGVFVTYTIEVVDIDSTVRRYAVGAATASGEAAAEVAVESAVSATRGSVPAAAVEELVYDVPSYFTDMPVQSGTARKALVSKTGVYSVNGSGNLYNFGHELSRLGEDGDCVFVRGIETFYTDENALWQGDLTVSGTPATLPESTVDGYWGSDGFTGVFRYEIDSVFDPNTYFPPGPNWYFPEEYDLNGATSYTLSVPVTSPVGGGTAEIRVSVRCDTDGDHDLQIRVNGISAGLAEWEGSGFYCVTATVTSSALVNGKNNVTLLTSGTESSKKLDYVEIRTPAEVKLRDGGLLVLVTDGASSQMTVSGGAILAVNATEAGSEALLNLDGGTVDGLAEGMLVYFTSSVKEPDWEDYQTLSVPDLSGVNYLAVAADGMSDALAPLVTYHREQGLACAALSMQSVTDIFGCGIYGPGALVSLSAQAGATYLLLAGTTTYDYLDREGLGTPVGIPVGFVQADEGLAATDDIYSNQFATAVGRFPARSASELTAMIDKTIAFRPASRVALLAGQDDAEGEFSRLQQICSELIPSEVIASTGRDNTVVRQELIDAINQGARVVAYQGHAGYQQIDHDALIGTGDVSGLPPAAWLLSTCLTGSYILNDWDTPVISHRLLREPGAGAVSLLCSTRYGDLGEEHILVEEALREMAASAPTWGQLLMNLKQELAYTETIDHYTLLGDPALSTVDFSQDSRAISITAPVDGEICTRDPVEIDILLSGEGWWHQTLTFRSRVNGGDWSEAGTLDAEAGKLSYTFEWRPSADGLYWQVQVDAGLTSEGMSIQAVSGLFTVDRVPPAVPEVISPADGSYVYSPVVSLLVTSSDETSGLSACQFEIDGETGEWQAEAYRALDDPGNGVHTWRCRARDAGGLESDWCPLYTFTYAEGGDTDGDNLLDEWELTYFGRLDFSDGSADSDGDGKTDREEFLAGTHPYEFYADAAAGWNLLALPCVPDTDTIVRLQAAFITPFWSWKTSGYEEIDAPVPFQGFWALALEDVSLTVSGLPPAENVIKLQPGWNQAGPGRESPLPQHPLIEAIWRWNGSSYEYLPLASPETLLRNLEGTWMMNGGDSPISVEIPVSDGTAE